MDNRQATLELGTKPVGKLLLQYALPAIVAMVAASLYNMVDSIFIGQGVGAMAISGLAITFPFMNLSAAFGAAIGVGSSTCLSVKLGQKDYQTAEKILGNTVVLNVIVGFTFGLLALIFLDPILYFFGATANTISYAREYMLVILMGCVFSYLYFGLNAVLRAAGKPRHAMYATIFTVVLNTILDPIFIWVFNMGIRGAAIATILSQVAALVWQLKIFSDKNEMLHFQRGCFKLRSDIVKNIVAIGISPFSMNACACIVVIFINTALVKHGGDLAVGAFGITNRIAFFFLMIVFGINQGMQPIAGYNYGAQRMDRLMKVLRYSIIAGITTMTVGFVISELMPQALARMFTTDPELTRLSVHAIKISMLAFPLIGFQAVVTNFFQSIGKAKISMFLSLSRQMIFLLPMLVVLPPNFGMDGVWASLPASDTAAFLTALVIMAVYMKKFQKLHNEQTYGKEENHH
ncbi:MAG: MATE family efflux transporter [Prevotella sp.]|nr:MATE family efflux transporter [Prevotella sp.]